MKKLLSTIFIISLLLTSVLTFSSCDALNSITNGGEEESTVAPSFTEYGETVNFDIPNATYVSTSMITDGEGIELTARANPKSSITPNPGYPFPTLEEFFNSAILDSYNGAQIKSENGVKYAEVVKNGNQAIYVFYETDNNFWYVLFDFDFEKTDYDTARAKTLEYAKSATFSVAE